MTDRIKRVNQLIKEKIANILEKEISFGDNILVTIQKVDTSRDLRNAKVGISIIPKEKSQEVLDNLKKQTRNIQRELNKAVEIKYVPKIEFQIDKGEENLVRIEELLRDI